MNADCPVLVHVPPQLGGVRHVTENLACGIEAAGREVVRAATIGEVIRAHARGRCDAAILSLDSGYVAGLFRRAVYVLHGFPVVDSYSPLRRVAVRGAARVALRSGASLVAVSHLTRAVHERLYGIPVDAVVFNGCGETLVARARSAVRPPKRRQVAYIGRLVDGKGLRRIVRGFLDSALPSLGYTLRIAGGGPLAGWISDVARARVEVELLGEISETEKENLLFESEAFVSLNDFEPMGVVFVEAVLAGCKIVAPYCGGHREFVPYGHPVALCDPSTAAEVAAALGRVVALPAAPPADPSLFSYRERIAPEYLRILDGDLAPSGVLHPSRAQRRAA